VGVLRIYLAAAADGNCKIFGVLSYRCSSRLGVPVNSISCVFTAIMELNTVSDGSITSNHSL
jgi:hypothetical protein